MADLHYEHPRLAALYDLESGWSEDRDFYLALAGKARQPILDLGCGTGLLCNAYAARGHDVTGADPSKAMLDVARRTQQGASIDWVQCLAQDFRSQKRFELIVMTGHAFQVLLDERDIMAAFAAMRDHLSRKGFIVFESRNPAIDWRRRWDGDGREFNLDEFAVRQIRRVLYSENNRIRFDTRYVFADEVLISSSELLFLRCEEISKNIVAAGLKVETVLGDWNGGTFDPSRSEEMIFFVRHP